MIQIQYHRVNARRNWTLLSGNWSHITDINTGVKLRERNHCVLSVKTAKKTISCTCETYYRNREENTEKLHKNCKQSRANGDKFIYETHELLRHHLTDTQRSRELSIAHDSLSKKHTIAETLGYISLLRCGHMPFKPVSEVRWRERTGWDWSPHHIAPATAAIGRWGSLLVDLMSFVRLHQRIFAKIFNTVNMSYTAAVQYTAVSTTWARNTANCPVWCPLNS